MKCKHNIKIADDLVITEVFSVNDFMKTQYYDKQNFLMFFWLNCGFSIDGNTFGVGLYFTDNLINKVFLHFRDDTVDEKAKMDYYAKFIRMHSEYGNAVAIYDERGAESLIVVDMQN
jgi:hypothetical protein